MSDMIECPMCQGNGWYDSPAINMPTVWGALGGDLYEGSPPMGVADCACCRGSGTVTQGRADEFEGLLAAAWERQGMTEHKGTA